MGRSTASSWETLASKTWLKKSSHIPVPGLDLPEIWAGVGFLAGALRGPNSPVQPEQLPLMLYWFAAQQPLSRQARCHPAALQTPLFSSCHHLRLHQLKARGLLSLHGGVQGGQLPFLLLVPLHFRCWWRLMGLSSHLHARENVAWIHWKKKNLFEEDLTSPNRTMSVWEQTCLSTSRIDLSVHIM